MMKARQYSRRILTDGVNPQVYHPAGFPEGEEYGSLVKGTQPPPASPAPPSEKGAWDSRPTRTDELVGCDYDTRLSAWNFQRLLAQKYDVVVTNPPYMGGSGMSGKMSEFVKKHYPDGKSDLFAVFIEKCGELLNPTGYQAMITQHAWMFLSSYEKLRGKLMHRDIVNMAHLGARAFEEIGGEVVQTTAFVLSKRNVTNFEATYVRLVDYSSQDAKEAAFLSGSDRHTARKENFEKIPGCPVAYWVSEAMLRAFVNGKTLNTLSDVRKGMTTSDNDRFIRFWFEISHDNFCIHPSKELSKRWYRTHKGGNYRKWYGNSDSLVDWLNNGAALKSFPNSVIRNSEYYFRECISWTDISSAKTSFRFVPEGSISNASGPSVYDNNKSLLLNYLGLLNSIVSENVLRFICPTIHFEIGQLSKFPVLQSIRRQSTVEGIVTKNISLSRADWDSFETSWDFKRHPLIPLLKEGTTPPLRGTPPKEGNHPALGKRGE
jgi:hypothetical protein